MKFYKLEYNSLNKKETGTQFQSTTGIVGDIQCNHIPFEGKINFAFNLPEPILEKKAKLTSYLNSMIMPSWFLILHNDFVEFITNFNLGEYQVWKIKIHFNGKIINDYKMFYLCDSMAKEVINYSQSEFYEAKYTNHQDISELIQISNHDDYVRKRDETSNNNSFSFLNHKTVLLDFSKLTVDIFKIINAPYSGLFVSERLKHAIEENGFTGMAFKEIEAVDKRIKVIY